MQLTYKLHSVHIIYLIFVHLRALKELKAVCFPKILIQKCYELVKTLTTTMKQQTGAEEDVTILAPREGSQEAVSVKSGEKKSFLWKKCYRLS